MKLKPALFLVSTVLLQSMALAQQSPQWGSSNRPARQDIEGMKTYYEPDKVQQNGSVYSFTLYRSSNPAVSDEAGRYMINCETRELVTVVGGQPSPPARLIAGEEIYPIGRKLCEWDQKSFFKKIFE